MLLSRGLQVRVLPGAPNIKGHLQVAFFICRLVADENLPVRQNGRIAVLDDRRSPAGRGPWMARVSPAGRAIFERFNQ
jgi:hypothetical protein